MQVHVSFILNMIHRISRRDTNLHSIKKWTNFIKASWTSRINNPFKNWTIINNKNAQKITSKGKIRKQTNVTKDIINLKIIYNEARIKLLNKTAHFGDMSDFVSDFRLAMSDFRQYHPSSDIRIHCFSGRFHGQEKRTLPRQKGLIRTKPRLEKNSQRILPKEVLSRTAGTAGKDRQPQTGAALGRCVPKMGSSNFTNSSAII